MAMFSKVIGANDCSQVWPKSPGGDTGDIWEQ